MGLLILTERQYQILFFINKHIWKTSSKNSATLVEILDFLLLDWDDILLRLDQ